MNYAVSPGGLRCLVNGLASEAAAADDHRRGELAGKKAEGKGQKCEFRREKDTDAMSLTMGGRVGP
jgi:hypothetical protein